MDIKATRAVLSTGLTLAVALLVACGSGILDGAGAKPLKQGDRVEMAVRSGETHGFRAFLEAGTVLDVVVDQIGADIALAVRGPDGKVVKEVDAQPRYSGREYLRLEAETAGSYLIECRASTTSGPAGRCRLIARDILTAQEYARRQVAIDRRAFEEYYGNFELGPGRVISIGPTDEFMHDGRLVYLDTSTRRFGKIFPLTDGTFYATPTLDDDLTAEIGIRFLRGGDGALTGLEWAERGKRTIVARRVFPGHAEEVSFTNGAATLSGILLMPDGAGPHPAMVFVHGSGASLHNQGFFLSFFQRLGMAVLSFDKRGAGRSTGDWRRSSFDDLASDIIAGVVYLKTRSDIDAERIGLHGISQAGWIGSLAAAASPDVKFLVINTGSGVSVADNMAHELEGTLRAAGLPEDQVLEAREFYRTLLHLASGGAAWEEIETWIAGAKGKPWLDRIRLAGLPQDNINWAWLRMNGGYDSAEALKRVKCPVLWFLGDRDWNVPSAASEPRIQAALASGGNADFQVLRLSPAGHVLIESETGFFDDIIRSPALFAAGYWDVLASWLADHVVSRGRSGTSGRR